MLVLVAWYCKSRYPAEAVDFRPSNAIVPIHRPLKEPTNRDGRPNSASRGAILDAFHEKKFVLFSAKSNSMFQAIVRFGAQRRTPHQLSADVQ